MKSLLFKLQQAIFLMFGFVLFIAQNKTNIPPNTVFYMEVNGKQLNQKVNWEKFNPFLREITKKNDKKPSWNDYSKTGIKYDETQYHYATMTDSLKSYNAHFMLDSQEKFMEFINSVKKKGQEITKKNNYSYIDIDNNSFVAWNGNHAFLTMISYDKPYKDNWDDEYAIDSAATVVDSVEIYADSIKTDILEEPVPFDYKEEIQYLKNDIKYLKESIKDNNAEIARIQKNIKYLEKHHKYPEEKIVPEISDEAVGDSTYAPKIEVLPPPISQDDYYEDEVYTVEDSTFQKRMDSLNIVEFKMVKKFAEDSFDRYFSSNMEFSASKDMHSFRDPNSDVFIHADYGRIMNEGFLGRAYRRYDYTSILGKMYNSNSSYNLYFDKDKVRLVNNYQHKDSETQKNILDVYSGKKNKKLAALINDKSIGYYVMNVDGSKYFNMIYGMLKNTGETEYQKEMELMIETMKIVLDEKAIAKIAPGNGIFVLNELKSKNVEYTDYEYDDDYNEKEVKKTKDIMVPNFTFAFATENQGYWNRVFDVLTSNKAFAKNFSKDGEFYSFKEEKSKNDYIEELFFTVKDEIVYVTTSKDNITAQNQSYISKQWMKDSSKYPLSGRLNIQKLLGGLDKEFKSKSEKGTLEILRKNAGEIYFKTEKKGNSIQTEMNYNIKSNSENSLMYFFDMINDFYKKSLDEKPANSF